MWPQGDPDTENHPESKDILSRIESEVQLLHEAEGRILHSTGLKSEKLGEMNLVDFFHSGQLRILFAPFLQQ